MRRTVDSRLAKLVAGIAIKPCRNSGNHGVKDCAHTSGTPFDVLRWADRVDGLFPIVTIQRKCTLPCIENNREKARRFNRLPVRHRDGQSSCSVRHGRHRDVGCRGLPTERLRDKINY